MRMRYGGLVGQASERRGIGAPYREGQSMIVFDTEKMRPYRAADLDRLLRFVGECNRVPDAGAIRHPGDVIHFMSNSLRGRDLERHIFLYEEDDGRLCALVMLYPGPTWNYELLARPRPASADDDAFETAAMYGLETRRGERHKRREARRRARKAARSAWN